MNPAPITCWNDLPTDCRITLRAIQTSTQSIVRISLKKAANLDYYGQVGQCLILYNTYSFTYHLVWSLGKGGTFQTEALAEC